MGAGHVKSAALSAAFSRLQPPLSGRPGGGSRAARERAAALLFEARAIGRVLHEVAADAARDGLGEPRLLLAAPQAPFLTRVRDVGGLDQHRGDGGRFKHHEAGTLNLRLADLADALERTHDALGGTRAHADNLVLRRIDQHRTQRTVIERYAAHEVRGVLAVGEYLGRLARCTVDREHVYGGP